MEGSETVTEATVVAIVAAQDTPGINVLLTRRNVEPFKDRWCLPGGTSTGTSLPGRL